MNDSTERRLLIVDDEAEMLSALETFFSLRDWEVSTCNDPIQAVSAFKETRPHVVMTDIMMPGFDGIELLHSIKTSGIPTEVIMMTGYTTVDRAYTAWAAGAYRRLACDRTSDSREKRTCEPPLKFAIASAECSTCGPLPASAARISALVGDPKSSIGEIVDVIEADQVAASRLLRLANSALYTHVVRIGTISEAVMQIGLTSLRNLVLSLEVVAAFDGRLESEFRMSRFWEHSVASALCSSSCAAKGTVEEQQSAFVAGLIHDIGEVIFLDLFPSDVARLLRKAIDTGDSFAAAEYDYFDLGHAEAGAMLAAAWRFPENLTHAIRFHHEDLGLDRNGDLTQTTRNGHLLAASYFERELGEPVVLSNDFFAQIGTTRMDWEAEHYQSIEDRVQVVCSAILSS